METFENQPTATESTVYTVFIVFFFKMSLYFRTNFVSVLYQLICKLDKSNTETWK